MLQGKREQGPSVPSCSRSKVYTIQSYRLATTLAMRALSREKQHYLIITQEPSGLCFTFKHTYIHTHFFYSSQKLNEGRTAWNRHQFGVIPS